MEISIFLAKVMGLFCLLSTTAIITQYKKSMSIEKEFVSNAGFAMFAGYCILIVGILLIVSHSVWVWDWRLVVTIMSWLIFLKGLGRVFFSNGVRQIIEKKQKDHRFILGEIAVWLIGIYLLYHGFLA